MAKRYWYLYNGFPFSDIVEGGYSLPLNPNLKPSCVGGGRSCALYLYTTGGYHPDMESITDRIISYLQTAKLHSYSSFPLTGQPFVTSKP